MRSFSQIASAVQPACASGCETDNLGQSANYCARPGTQPLALKRGTLPVIIALCPGDQINDAGRLNDCWVPESVVLGHFVRCAIYSPAQPGIAALSAQGVKAGGDLALTLASSVVLAQTYLIPGFSIDISTSLSVPPGICTFTIAGFFENGAPWEQTVQVSPTRVGTSRFIVLATRESSGGAYPVPAKIDVAPADLTITVTRANVGTGFYVEGLTPVSSLWDTAAEVYYDNRETGR